MPTDLIEQTCHDPTGSNRFCRCRHWLEGLKRQGLAEPSLRAAAHTQLEDNPAWPAAPPLSFRADQHSLGDQLTAYCERSYGPRFPANSGSNGPEAPLRAAIERAPVQLDFRWEARANKTYPAKPETTVTKRFIRPG